jgi:hypothetical protein
MKLPYYAFPLLGLLLLPACEPETVPTQLAGASGADPVLEPGEPVDLKQEDLAPFRCDLKLTATEKTEVWAAQGFCTAEPAPVVEPSTTPVPVPTPDPTITITPDPSPVPTPVPSAEPSSSPSSNPSPGP